MKPILILILSLSLILTALGQAPIDSGFTNKAEAKNITINGLKDGKWMEYLDKMYMPTTDTLHLAQHYQLAFYRNGLLSGIVRKYNLNGKLEMTVPYTDGNQIGMIKYYYESGELSEETPVINGKINGVEKCYYENGKLKSESSHTDDIEIGTRKVYYETGVLKAEYPYSQGKVNGVSKGYYENGKIRYETPYVNDSVIGIAKHYYESGKLMYESANIKGYSVYGWPIQNGSEKGYYEDGRERYETPYVKGLRNGLEKRYYEDGHLESESVYTNDIMGESTHYDEKGNVLIIPNFIKRGYWWTIVNITDSTELFNLDTLKLILSYSDIRNPILQYSPDSCSFKFYVKRNADSTKKDFDFPNTIFKSGKCSFDSGSNTIVFYIRNKNGLLLKYSIQEINRDYVLLIKKN
jgi:antitoxin component YwqK of YwqJK toxin-antitoxin module